MNILNRILLFLLSLTVAAASLLVLLFCLGTFPAPVWSNELVYAASIPESIIGSALAFLISLFALYRSFSGTGKSPAARGSSLIVHSPTGDVRVEYAAVRELVDRAVLAVSGVREVKMKMLAKGESVPLQLYLRLILSPGTDAARVSADVTARVRQQVEQFMGLKDVPVDITIAGVSGRIAERKHRVV